MAVILEIKAGPFAGKRVAVMGGQTVTVGRTDRANFAISHDTFMSSLHFTVEYGPRGCVLTDQSRNGTFVNGARVKQVTLSAGDEVRSGQTVFAVRIVDEEPIAKDVKPAGRPTGPLPLPVPLPFKAPEPTSKLAPNATKERAAPPPGIRELKPTPPIGTPPGKPPLKIGGWTFSKLPEQWIAQGEYGIQLDSPATFPSSAVATEEKLGAGISLQQHVEFQINMFRKYLREPQIDATVPPRIAGAEESIAVEILYKTKDGPSIFYRHVYARSDRAVGLLTFTTLESELGRIRPDFDAILSAVRFAPSTNRQGQDN